MTHVHLAPADRIEAQALVHLLCGVGVDARADLGPHTHDDSRCGGVVLVVLQGPVTGTAAVRAALGDVPVLLLVGKDLDVQALSQSCTAAGVVTWDESATSLVAAVRNLTHGTLPAIPPARSTVVAVEEGPLTEREREIASMLVGGWRNDEIARELGISTHTVRTHVSKVLSKFEVSHRVALAVKVRTDPAIPHPRRPDRREVLDVKT